MVVYSVPSTDTLPLVQVGTSSVCISIVAFSSMTSTTGTDTGCAAGTVVSVDTQAMLRIAVLAIAIVASTFFILVLPLFVDEYIITYSKIIMQVFCEGI